MKAGLGVTGRALEKERVTGMIIRLHHWSLITGVSIILCK